jgi:hypothetical protein
MMTIVLLLEPSHTPSNRTTVSSHPRKVLGSVSGDIIVIERMTPTVGDGTGTSIRQEYCPNSKNLFPADSELTLDPNPAGVAYLK